MKVTSNMEVGIIDKIKCIKLIFEDNTEVRIGEISDCDLDLDSIEYSSISFTTAFIYDKVLAEFKRKEIKHIYINFSEIDTNDMERVKELKLDIDCRMRIRKCRISGNFVSSVPDIYVELEGMVM